VRRISSKTTWFHKKAFPFLWFGFLAFFLLIGVVSGVVAEAPVFVVVPMALAAFGFVLMKLLIWDLVDEVRDGGDYLIVRNRGDEARVPLSEIMNVSASTHINPPRITLRLVRPGKFGNEITFSPVTPFSLNPFAKNAIAEDLIVRVDRARAQRQR
jgi:hypothetical protein